MPKLGHEKDRVSVSPGPGLWSFVLGPFGPDLGPRPGPELDNTYSVIVGDCFGRFLLKILPFCRYTDLDGDLTPNEKVLYDLGLGRKTNFKYPWQPEASPDFCLNAVTEFGIGSLQCNEFYFTRAYLLFITFTFFSMHSYIFRLFNEVTENVQNILRVSTGASTGTGDSADNTDDGNGDDSNGSGGTGGTGDSGGATGGSGAAAAIEIQTCFQTVNCGYDDSCHKHCAMNTNYKKKCKVEGVIYTVDGELLYQGRCVNCTNSGHCPGKGCNPTTNQCDGTLTVLNRFATIKDTQTSVIEPLARTQDAIGAMQTSGASVAEIFGNTR